MYAFLSGKIVQLMPTVILENSGIGYKIECSSRTISSLKSGDETTLWTYLHVKEDALDLFGFLSQEDVVAFRMLISVSGVGPRTALAMMNETPQAIAEAIESGNISFFTQFSRVGKRLAHNIIIDLKSSTAELVQLGLTTQDPKQAEILEALNQMGYPQPRAEKVLRELDLSQSEDKILKAALIKLNQS